MFMDDTIHAKIQRKVQQTLNTCKINMRSCLKVIAFITRKALVIVARDIFLQDWKLKSVRVEHHCDKKYIMTVTAYSITQLDPHS